MLWLQGERSGKSSSKSLQMLLQRLGCTLQEGIDNLEAFAAAAQVEFRVSSSKDEAAKIAKARLVAPSSLETVSDQQAANKNDRKNQEDHGHLSAASREIEKTIRNENPRQYYQIFGELGRGGFGTV